MNVTGKELEHINSSKKRPCNFRQWKSVSAKMSRNAGDPYLAKSGLHKPGVPLPSGNKACGPTCLKPYCMIGQQRQEQLHEDFYGSQNYDVQTALLMSMIRRVEPSRRLVAGPSQRESTFKYFLPNEQGIMQEICRATLINVIGISASRVRGVQDRIRNGRFTISDGRGTHQNRPHALDPQIRVDILDHINSFPSELSHYSRNNGNPQRRYIDKQLTVRKMFNLYNAAVGPQADGHFWIYLQEFKRSGLIIGPPRSDTCATCDRIYTQLCSTSNPQQIYNLDLESLLHHSIADSAYAEMKLDISTNMRNPVVEVMTFDLQQVLFCPVLTNSNYFYQRKYSCFNFAITNPKDTNKTNFYYWHESIAGRGADEVASCILRMIRDTYQPLAPGATRTLITYSDRCTGQNCNWSVICMFRVIVYLGYFTEIIHKFMTTGHSFLPCDREFAVIENAKKSASINVPEDWPTLIRSAKASNVVVEMQQNDFVSFDGIKYIYRQPGDLKITRVLGIRLVSAQPQTIFTRLTHEPGTPWEEHRADHRFVINPNPVNLPQKYNNPLPICHLKKLDLMSMCQYLLPQYRGFYQNL